MAGLKPRICIIENQYTQYCMLAAGLESRYEIHPPYLESETDRIRDFKAFIEPVKIYLDERYDKIKRRELAFALFIKSLTDFKPELLIIDHILVGSSSALTGLELAQKIREKYLADLGIPILFVSRSPKDQFNVMSALELVTTPRKWINKGYHNEPVFEGPYLENSIIKAITELLRPIVSSETKTLLLRQFDSVELKTEIEKIILDREQFEEGYDEFMSKLFALEEFTDAQTRAITDFAANTSRQQDQIEEFYLKLVSIIESS